MPKRRRSQSAPRPHTQAPPAGALYPIRAKDEPLIHAAIGFGDWLLRQPEITGAGRAAVARLQEALRRLPQHSPGFCASYGFTVWPTMRKEFRTPSDYVWDGIVRTWDVSMIWRGELEVLSLFTGHASAAPQDEDEWQLSFRVNAGGDPCPGTWYYDRWIAEVARLDRWRGTPGATLVFEAEYGEWGPSGREDPSTKLHWEAETPEPSYADWAMRPWDPSDEEQASHNTGSHFLSFPGEYDAISKVLNARGLPLATAPVVTPTRHVAPLTFVESPGVAAPRFLDIRRPLDLDFHPEVAEELGLDMRGTRLADAVNALRERRYDGITFLDRDDATGSVRRLWGALDDEQVLSGDVDAAARRLNQLHAGVRRTQE